ncbi:Uncharacterized protein (UPF0240) [Halocaridina rubra]|uniref:Uncharacterized protein (UPF0240) n=1 Tax=Halocaridina rubra TaxID=373956 RepID=A0AAN9AHA0_HALRR
MGKVFSTLGRKATKPIRDYNIEERAHRAITKPNRPSAPRHPTTVQLIEESIKNQPEELRHSLKEKDLQLLKRLEDVYVTSEDVSPQVSISSKNPHRPLPADRAYIVEPEYGFHEPLKVPYGKITLRDALAAISKHQENPGEWTAKKISYEYKIDLGLTEKMLIHFRTFVLVLPNQSKNHKLTKEMLEASSLKAPILLEDLTRGHKQTKNREDKNAIDS